MRIKIAVLLLVCICYPFIAGPGCPGGGGNIEYGPIQSPGNLSQATGSGQQTTGEVTQPVPDMGGYSIAPPECKPRERTKIPDCAKLVPDGDIKTIVNLGKEQIEKTEEKADISNFLNESWLKDRADRIISICRVCKVEEAPKPYIPTKAPPQTKCGEIKCKEFVGIYEFNERMELRQIFKDQTPDARGCYSVESGYIACAAPETSDYKNYVYYGTPNEVARAMEAKPNPDASPEFATIMPSQFMYSFSRAGMGFQPVIDIRPALSLPLAAIDLRPDADVRLVAGVDIAKDRISIDSAAYDVIAKKIIAEQYVDTSNPEVVMSIKTKKPECPNNPECPNKPEYPRPDFCGNGVVDSDRGEECDPTCNKGPNWTCDKCKCVCTLQECPLGRYVDPSLCLCMEHIK